MGVWWGQGRWSPRGYFVIPHILLLLRDTHDRRHMIRPTVNTLAPSSVVISSLQHPICWEMSVVGNKVTDLGQHSTAYHSCMVSMSGGLHVGCHNSAPAQIRGHIAPPAGTTRSASHAVSWEVWLLGPHWPPKLHDVSPCFSTWDSRVMLLLT